MASSPEVQESPGCLNMGAVLHDGGGIDDLAAHLLGGGVNHLQARAESVRAVDYAAVHVLVGDPGRDLLDVGAISNETGVGEFFLVQLIEGQDLLGVLAHGHVAVAHAEEHVPGLEKPGQLVK